MIKLILLLLLLGLSLLAVFKAPTNGLWYLAIAVTEFPWFFMLLVVLLLFLPVGAGRYQLASVAAGVSALILYAIPIIGAYRIGRKLAAEMDAAFAPRQQPATTKAPFQITKMISGIGAPAWPFQHIYYKGAPGKGLSLDFYAARQGGERPCVVVIHGGSWAGGNSRQLPELNTYLAQKGYHVAAINYSLAPKALFPAPVEDVKAALDYLTAAAARLHIDTTRFILLGRSAGAQVALTAAYTSGGKNIKGVIGFYGPTDMVWGYANPAHPLVMDSKKVMEAYLGGTYERVPMQYTQSAAIETVNAAAPPTLLIHGKNDPLVAYVHSTRLVQKLKHFGVPHYLLTLPWATHGCDYTLNGPSGQLAVYAVERFLQEVLP